MRGGGERRTVSANSLLLVGQSRDRVHKLSKFPAFPLQHVKRKRFMSFYFGKLTWYDCKQIS